MPDRSRPLPAARGSYEAGTSRGRPTVGRAGVSDRLGGAALIAGGANSTRAHRRSIRAGRPTTVEASVRERAMRVRSGVSAGGSGGPAPGAIAVTMTTAASAATGRTPRAGAVWARSRVSGVLSAMRPASPPNLSGSYGEAESCL